MNKSIDERLFEQLMRAPHGLRRAMMPRGPEGQPGHPGHGCQGGGHGHGGSHGPEGCHGGPKGKGHHGPEHRRRMRAFAQERMLRILAEQNHGLHQKDLVEAFKINPSSVSELISKLEAEGYAVRTVDPEDKRATLITLTEVGRARAYELEDERKERFAGLFSNLTEEEKEQLLRLLEKLSVRPEMGEPREG